MARAPKPKSPGKAAGIKGNKPLCSTPPRQAPRLPDAVMGDARRVAAILPTRLKWLNGTVLHYCFFTGNHHFAVPKKQADAIRVAFAAWKAVGIGLEFQEVAQLSEAEVRIGYNEDDGVSESYVGRDVLDHSSRRIHDTLRLGP